MDWLGLSGAGFAAALVGLGAAVVVLYLLKDQRRRATVPALALWETLLKSRAQAALSTRLRRILSLLLALTVLVILLFALADLRQHIVRSGRSVVILLDRSASMAATDEPDTRLAAARRLAMQLIDDIGPTDRALIVALDQQATPHCTWTNDRLTLRAAVDSVKQSDMTGDLLPGLRLALDALRGHDKGELFLVSDGNLTGEARAEQLLAEHGEERARGALHYLRVGTSTRNVGITGFAVRSYPLDQRHLEGVLSLRNFGKEAERLTLSVSAAGTPLYEEDLTLQAGEAAFRTLSDLPWSDAPLRASLKLSRGPDPLASDDHAHASMPEQKRLRVLVVSDGNRYLEAALLLDEYLEVVEQTPAQYKSAQGFEVVIFDRVRPGEDPGVPALYLGAPDGPGFFPLTVKASVERPFFDRVDSKHPVLRLLSLRDVNLARALRSTPESSDEVIAETADRVPLIVEGTRKAAFLVMTFDARESDLPLRPAWPLLLLRSLERLAARTDTESSSQLAGQLIRVQVPSATTQAMLETPSDTRMPLQVSQGEARFLAERAGLYRVQQGELEATFAINVDTLHEGLIAPRSDLLKTKASHPRAGAVSSLWPERLWPWFVVVALLLLALEWLSFHRRWTV